MSRVRLNPYGISKSATALARYLGIKKLLVTGSQFVGKNTDTIINWGIGKGNVGNARQINKLSNVQLASNKIQTFKKLMLDNIPIPRFTTYRSELVPEKLYMARTTVTGHSGRGIVIGTSSELPDAPLYVEYINKVSEYRAIVVGNEVVDFKQKRKRRSQSEENPDGWTGEHDRYVWNLDGGYIFARGDVSKPDGIDDISISTINSLGLDFGAVDIIEDEEGNLYVLEVNTAFGLEGTTIELVGNAISNLVQGG